MNCTTELPYGMYVCSHEGDIKGVYILATHNVITQTYHMYKVFPSIFTPILLCLASQ